MLSWLSECHIFIASIQGLADFAIFKGPEITQIPDGDEIILGLCHVKRL